MNNFAMLHSRDAYQNEEDEAPRHLLRLWLSSEENGMVIPDGLKKPFAQVFEPGDDFTPYWNEMPDAEDMSAGTATSSG